jgi:S-adenosylmethionine decarboxylase
MSAPEFAALHLMGNLHGCGAHALMSDGAGLREQCIALARAAGLTVVGDYFHQFDAGGGVTGTVVLAESHLAVHTWPETGYVTLDVFVCNVSQDNRHKAEQLFEALLAQFAPGERRVYRVDRS